MDCHCHLGVKAYQRDPIELMQSLDEACHTKNFFSLMTTNLEDFSLVEQMLDHDHNGVLLPHFGVHPWFAHLFTLNPDHTKRQHYSAVISGLTDDLLDILPDPVPLSDHLSRIETLISKCESRGIRWGIGEIGLDKIFRIPSNGYYGRDMGGEAVSLTAARVTMEHQASVLELQLEVANRHERPVSLHCVKAHGLLYEILQSSYLQIPSLVLHSYTGSLDQAKRWIKTFNARSSKLYFSLSSCINVKKETAFVELLKILPDSSILVETDMPIDDYFLTQKHDTYQQMMTTVIDVIKRHKSWDDPEFKRTLELNFIQLHSP